MAVYLIHSAVYASLTQLVHEVTMPASTVVIIVSLRHSLWSWMHVMSCQENYSQPLDTLVLSLESVLPCIVFTRGASYTGSSHEISFSQLFLTTTCLLPLFQWCMQKNREAGKIHHVHDIRWKGHGTVCAYTWDFYWEKPNRKTAGSTKLECSHGPRR